MEDGLKRFLFLSARVIFMYLIPKKDNMEEAFEAENNANIELISTEEIEIYSV